MRKILLLLNKRSLAFRVMYSFLYNYEKATSYEDVADILKELTPIAAGNENGALYGTDGWIAFKRPPMLNPLQIEWSICHA